MKKQLTRFLFLFLIVAVCLPVAAAYAIPRASLYISNYLATTDPTGSGGVRVSFSITGTGPMDTIGATDIDLYEKPSGSSKWTLIKHFDYTQNGNSNMMGYNKNSHASYVSYAGVSGNQYYAIVYFWAGKDGGGDSRPYTTSTITAQ